MNLIVVKIVNLSVSGESTQTPLFTIRKHIKNNLIYIILKKQNK